MKATVWLLIFFSCLTFYLSAYNLLMVKTHPLKFETEIIKNANTFNLPTELVASVINVESSFRKDSKSSRNAIGLMQIKLSTANYLNQLENKENITETDLFSPSINVYYGCKYLRYLLNKFKILNTSLAAYNAGETRVREWLKKYSTDGLNLNYIPYIETKNYVEKVTKNIKFYSKIFA